MHGFEDLLDRTAPRLLETPALHDDVAALVESTRLAAARRRRVRRRVAAGAATAVLVGVAGTAAAAGGVWSGPWEDHPVTSITYTLPSGTTCSQKIGNLHIADPDAETLIRDWLASRPLDDLIDVRAAITELRSEPWRDTSDNGRAVRVGYGTDHYDADYEYDSAVWLATSVAVRTKLDAAGYTSYLDTTWNANTVCTGSNPHPAVPSWEK